MIFCGFKEDISTLVRAMRGQLGRTLMATFDCVLVCTAELFELRCQLLCRSSQQQASSPNDSISSLTDHVDTTRRKEHPSALGSRAPRTQIPSSLTPGSRVLRESCGPWRLFLFRRIGERRLLGTKGRSGVVLRED